jgi:hypothetical protein
MEVFIINRRYNMRANLKNAKINTLFGLDEDSLLVDVVCIYASSPPRFPSQRLHC